MHTRQDMIDSNNIRRIADALERIAEELAKTNELKTKVLEERNNVKRSNSRNGIQE